MEDFIITLLDFISAFDENKTLVVMGKVDGSYVEVSRYDGRDSIDEACNDMHIFHITTNDDGDVVVYIH